MRQASTDTLPSPVTVKRYPWMRRFDFYSPKAQRRLTLFSHATLSLWTVLESRPSITRFCEYPGYVLVNGERVIADFWAEDKDSAQAQFLVIPDGLRVEPESPTKARLYASRVRKTVGLRG